MKTTMLLSALLALGMLPVSLQAHTELSAARPADGAVLNMAPAALELDFSEEVQLLKLELARADGSPMPDSFMPTAQARSTFSVPLPPLSPGAYKASWTVLGKDGHRMEGSLGFTLDPAAAASDGSAAHAGHEGH